jgi:hypothetical protein
MLLAASRLARFAVFASEPFGDLDVPILQFSSHFVSNCEQELSGRFLSCLAGWPLAFAALAE